MKKLPFPTHLLKTPCMITLYREGLTEQGEPKAAYYKACSAIFFEKSRTIMTQDNRIVQLRGKIILKGDVAPSIKTISDGAVVINNEATYRIYQSERARNPDGSVHHTVLELM